jgi:dTDP-4-dehydrorhamnose reductase
MASPEFAVFGAAGQLGQELISRLPEGTVAWTRKDADLNVPGQISELLRRNSPKVVFNCAAYNLVDQAEEDFASAFAVNAFAVRDMALACCENNASLVHFSSDYVFGLDHQRSKPYLESDLPGPVSTYGLSKLTGEHFVRAYCQKHFVIRTCGLYGLRGVGGKGGNFVETMVRLASAGKPIRVVNDQILTPSSAADVADVTLQLIQNAPSGLYHLTNGGQCSWFEFAAAILEAVKVRADLTPISSAEYGSKAARPAYSALASEHRHIPGCRPWQEALREYLSMRAIAG